MWDSLSIVGWQEMMKELKEGDIAGAAGVVKVQRDQTTSASPVRR